MSEQPTEQKTAPAVGELPQRRLMLVMCRNRYLQSIKEEFEDWQREVITSGTTHKASDGFLLFGWRGPVPRRFLDKLRTDADIFDYVPINLLATT